MTVDGKALGQTDAPPNAAGRNAGPAPGRPSEDTAQLSAHTTRAYAGDWKHFSSWCKSRNLPPLPPDSKVVAAYLTALASGDEALEAKPSSLSTIERRLSAIGWNYARRGLQLDRANHHLASAITKVRETLSADKQQKDFLSPEEFLAIIETLDRDTLRGLRDRAILLVGYAGGLKRSEIVGLDRGPNESHDGIGWIKFLDEGMIIHLVRGRRQREVEIARGSSDRTCPVVAVRQWLALARIPNGPLFRRIRGSGRLVAEDRLRGQEVARLIKRAASQAGIRNDLSTSERNRLFGGESLRHPLTSSLGKSGMARNQRRFQINVTRALGL